MKSEKIRKLILFVIFINLTPNFRTLNTFFLNDHLNFSTTDLADIKTFSRVCYVLAIFLYYQKFKGV